MANAIDGQLEAAKLLRTLQETNWNGDKPVKSARILEAAIRRVQDWPANQRAGFMRVISDWLVTELLGCGYDLDEYEETLKFGKAVMQAQRDRAFQEFCSKMKEPIH